MRLLANENIPWDAVAALRQEGHNVIWVRANAPGSSDSVILAWAQREERIVITFDKDFGELAFRQGLPAQSGIILLRFEPASPAIVAETILRALQTRGEWSGLMTVVEQDRIRTTPLP